MTTEAILKPIGKGQITIPLSWRKKLNIDQKPVRARYEYKKIIIEPIEEETTIDWDISAISLDQLNQETQKAIQESEKNYKAGKTEKFMNLKEFWNEMEN